MASDSDWVEDVRQWYFNGGRPSPKKAKVSDEPLISESFDLGYEAAYPALQAKNWNESLASEPGSLR